MSELLGHTFLRLLHHAVRRHELTVAGPTPRELAELERAASKLVAREDEAVLSVEGDAFFLGERMLAHASLEFHGLLRQMQERQIDSITLLAGGVSVDGLERLAALIAGRSDAPPRRSGVRVNERPFPPWRLRRLPTADLREAYTQALDTLRRFSGGLALDLSAAERAVDRFVGQGERARRASLVLALVHNVDEIVVYHSVNVCLLSLALGDHIGLSEESLRMLGVGALLHDVGRIARADGIEEQPERLTTEDWSKIRLHPQDGAAAILASAGPGEEVLARVALEHHLRVDGTGYPDLPGIEPHPFARIVGIADVYEAITADRPHRPGRTPAEAMRIILDGAGTAHDRDLVAAFAHLLGDYPPGSLLRLTGGDLVMSVPSDPGDLRAVAVQTASGDELSDPESFEVDRRRIAGEVTPAEAGVDPGALLEQVVGLVPVA